MLPAGEKPVRLESDPNRGSPIRLRRGRQQGRGPLLVLKKCGDIEISGHPQIGLYEFVVQLYAAWYEISVNLLVPVSKLEAALRAEPVIHPRLLARSFASDPAAHDDFVVGIGVVVEEFEVRELARMASRGRRVGENPFDTQIKFRDVRKLRQIQSPINGRAPRRINRVWIIAGHRVRVQRQPVPDKWQFVREIESTQAMARIIVWTVVKRTRISHIAVPDGPKRHGSSLPAKFRRTAESKLEILRGLEGDFFPVENRVRRKIIPAHPSGEQINFHRPDIAEYPWKRERPYAAEPEHINRLGVVAEEERASVVGRPPQVLLAEGKVPAIEICAEVRVLDCEAIHPRDG